MRISDRLLKRLSDEFGLRLNRGARLVRCYPGYWQRSAGAFVWAISNPNGPAYDIGSSWPMRECLFADSLSLSPLTGHIDVCANKAGVTKAKSDAVTGTGT